MSKLVLDIDPAAAQADPDTVAALFRAAAALAPRRPARPRTPAPARDGPGPDLEPLPRQKQQREWPAAKPPANGHANGHGNGAAFDGAPRSGKALYRWAQQQEAGASLVQYLKRWAKDQSWHWKFDQWDRDQVAAGYAEAVRWLEAPTS